MFKNLLLTVDIAAPESAAKSVEAAVSLARSHDAMLHLLNVVPDTGMAIVGASLAPGQMEKALEAAEASAVQPFTYLHLVFASAIGVWGFGETLEPTLIVGAALVVGAGLFTIWRERQVKASAPS